MVTAAPEPEYTGAEFYSKEYWQGHDAAVHGVAMRWEQALTAPIPAPGVMNEPLESLYRRTEALRTAQPKQQPVAITAEQAHEIGAKGAEPTNEERLLFEAWMRGHCWAVVGEWDGKTYKHENESTGFVHPATMTTRRLWAAWRDRAALTATQLHRKPPQFPTVLRKMWSGTEVQEWINENWNKE